MDTEDTRDYLAAFAIGAAVGIGVTLLLSPPGGTRRIIRELEPALKRSRKAGHRMADEVRHVAREFGRGGERAVDATRAELKRAAARRMKKARRALHRW